MKYLKNQRGIVPIIEVFLVIAVLGVFGFVVYRAVSTKPVLTGSSSPQEVGETKVHIDETMFELDLPAGWSKKDEAPISNEQGTAYYYGDEDGNFFDVFVDLGGRDFASDYTWVTKRDGDGLTIAQENTLKEGDGFSDAGNGKLYIGITAPQQIEGHYYFMQAGNKNSETVDRQVYRDILATLKVK